MRTGGRRRGLRPVNNALGVEVSEAAENIFHQRRHTSLGDKMALTEREGREAMSGDPCT
jgi:hypothetical protein